MSDVGNVTKLPCTSAGRRLHLQFGQNEFRKKGDWFELQIQCSFARFIGTVSASASRAIVDGGIDL